MNEETPKPNLDFIVNQPGPELAKPKRSKKPLAIIGVALVILVALTAFAAIFGKKATNVQKVMDGETEAAQFLAYIGEGKSSEAYNMLEPIAQLDKAFFTDNLVQPYSQRFDLKNCVFETNGYETTVTEAKLTYDCPFIDKKNGDHVTLAMAVNRKTSKIAKIEMVTKKT